MPGRLLTFITFCCLVGASHHVNSQTPELIGVAAFSATMPDHSGLTGLLSKGEPHNRFGGVSAIEYTGQGNQYFALADRGPDDGDTTYECRLHKINLEIKPAAAVPVKVELLDTCLLMDSQGRPHVGDSRVFVATPQHGQRLDPEGVRRLGQDQLLICEEYGPMILRFDTAGKELASIPVPPAYTISKAAASKTEENQNNESGRASNKGLEGMAISPDGKTITCVMQNVMLQDGQRDEDGAPHGYHCRILQIDLEVGTTRQYVYHLDHPDNVLSEILAVSSTEFLVIERDYRSGNDAQCKHIKRIDLADATDINGLDRLPPAELPEDIQPATKKTFLDMLDPRYGLVGKGMPEKLEGLAFGPDLSDGRKTLIIASDNDFELSTPSYFYVFGCAIDSHSIAR